MGCGTLGPGATYLGNPLFLTRRKAKDFEYLKQRVITRLESWQSQLLSKAGKGVLIKSVVQALPAYAMATFKMPLSFCDNLDGLVRRFWWTGGLQKKKYLALGAWDSFCRPKQCGGLGFRRFRDINASLLANLAWDLFSKKNKLWVEVLSSKYVKNKDIWNLTTPKNCSWGFRSIISCKNIILKGACFVVGSGETIRVWQDPWLPSIPTFRPTPGNNVGIDDSLTVDKLIDPSSGSWNLNALSAIFNNETITAILTLSRPSSPLCDKLIWTKDKQGYFTSKSTYWVLNETRFTIESLPGGFSWRKFWRNKMPERLKLL